MVGLFDSDWKFKFGETDQVVITCEGKPHAIEQVRDLAKFILSLDSYQLEQCLLLKDSKENPEATISKLRMYIKEVLKHEADENNVKILKEALLISGGKDES